MLVHWSPQATIIADRTGSIPIILAASMVIGPWAAHCPPPDGMNTLMIPAAQNWNM